MNTINVTVFAFLLILLTVNTVIVGAGETNPMQQHEPMKILKIVTQTTPNVPNSFDAYFYKALEPKGLIVYFHGGGCTRSITWSTWALNPVLQSLLVDKNYSLLLVDYTKGINHEQFSFSEKKFSCKEATLAHLNRATFIPGQLPSEYTANLPTYFFGHSYGAYLVNLMATSKIKIEGVKGFISYAGAWDPPTEDYSTHFHFSHELRPIDNDSKNLSNLLVMQSKDDDAVSFHQFEVFKSWATTANSSYIKAVPFDQGGHLAHTPENVSTVVETIESFCTHLSSPD